MARRSRLPGPIPDGGNIIDLLDYLPVEPHDISEPGRRRSRPPWAPLVTTDLPEHLPVSERELDIVELHFADLLDELLSRKS
ncbi:hypothetical protein [Sphingomonas sp.]|uniref:hypothetical protein n=1 Tax=Sphingomonas sp. TaxID=28214 RepID=UPI0025D6416F|nr:hypothetical protein [Sphingomonas sp.]MBV9529085.1 hypothetical protein [Sphingomonas sp.]